MNRSEQWGGGRVLLVRRAPCKVRVFIECLSARLERIYVSIRSNWQLRTENCLLAVQYPKPYLPKFRLNNWVFHETTFSRICFYRRFTGRRAADCRYGNSGGCCPRQRRNHHSLRIPAQPYPAPE